MASFHARSNSLPSRPHLIVSEIEEHLNRLRDSQATSTSSSSINSNLISLQDLHDCVDKLLLLPLTQQVLAQENCRKQVDEVLDGSLRILDLCNIIKDVLSLTKESVQELQSVIRRRQGGLETEIKKYISSRKIVKKTIKKALKNLKRTENKSVSFSCVSLTILKEAEAITVITFESFLSFIAEPKSQSKPRGWSLVSKLMQQKRVACSEEQETVECEFAEVDEALEAMVTSKARKGDDLQKKLQSLEVCIEHLEEGIESVFKVIECFVMLNVEVAGTYRIQRIDIVGLNTNSNGNTSLN